MENAGHVLEIITQQTLK